MRQVANTGVIWGRCGQPVEIPAPAPLRDDDAGHDKYTRGALGRYIKTGLEDLPLERAAPAAAALLGDDPQLATDRGIRMPRWGDDAGP